MISFTCGTYHGLFVDTGVPSVLPKDISYFDLRTRGGRTIPPDNTPNLIIRYTSSGEQRETPMIMVALCYRAIEGNREGFIAFGSLIFEPFSSKNIEDGIQTAIRVARNSTDIFNGKTILRRPTQKEGRQLDLTRLPLLEVGKFFGELNTDINIAENIKNVSDFTLWMLSSGIDHFEIVVNPRRGMGPNELVDHFKYLVSQQKIEIENLRERTKRLQDRKRQEEALQAQRLIDQRNHNSFRLQVLAIGMVGIAILGLVAFLIYSVAFSDNESVVTQAHNTEVSTSESSAFPPKVVDNVEADNCTLETLTEVDKQKYMVISDLQTDGKCINISENVTNKFQQSALDQIITSENSDFRVSMNSPKDNQIFLTSFGRLVDSVSDSKYVDSENNFVLPDKLFSVAISMETVSPRLICSANVAESNAFNKNVLKFEYYTLYQNDYREEMKKFSSGVLYPLGKVFNDMSEKIKNDSAGNKNVTAAANELRHFGDDLRNDKIRLELKHYDATSSDTENICIILITDEDTQSFYRKFPSLSEITNQYSLKEFVNLVGNTFFDKYSDLDADEFLIECHKIPGLFMIWNAESSHRMVMDETSGFVPYTKEGENFDYKMKSIEYFQPDVYNLPEKSVFSNLNYIFTDEKNRMSPFSSNPYNITEDFCYAPNL